MTNAERYEWTSMMSARMLFDNDAHLLRMHDIYCGKELN